MPVEVVMPALGESITEGTVVRFLKNVGDVVARDEELVVMATDKVETELPAPAAGTLLAVRVKEGDVVPVGTVIAVLGEPGEQVVGAPESSSPRSRSVATSPRAVSASTMARDAGAEAPGPAGAGPTEPRARNAEHRITGDPKLFVSPAVRRLLREHDVDLGAVEGSGRGGRVTRKDVERAVAAGLSRSGFSTPDGGWRPGQRRGGSLPFEPATAARYAPRVEPGDTVVPLAPMARAMAEHMAFTWWRSPHVSTLVEVDMASVARHRQAHKASIASRGGKLSYTAYVARALAAVLPRHPRFNASLVGHDERIERGSVNLGVAVARADGGLVVPVLRGAQELSLGGVALRLAELSERARAGRITGAELQGGSFTLTNVGSNGNLASFPLLNQPQVGILAMGAVTKRVVVMTEAGEDRIVIRPRMFLTLTYDHRCADGAASGRMLRELRERLEAWSEDP